MRDDDYRQVMNGYAFDSNGDSDYVKFYKDNPKMINRAIFNRLPIAHVLDYATWTDYKIFKTIKALLSMGADPNSKSGGEYVADIAHSQDRIGVYEIIKKAGGKAPVGDRKEEDFEREWKQKKREDIERVDLKNKPETFGFGRMTITNAGVVERDMIKIMAAVKKMTDRLKSKGFGHLLYGPIIVVPDKLDASVWDVSASKFKPIEAAALYSPSRDWVTINADHFIRDANNGLKTFAHELGHRQWFKFMDATKRKWWRGEYEERGTKISKSLMKHVISVVEWAAPTVTDSFGNKYRDWIEFNYDKFMRKMRQGQKKYNALDALDTAAQKYHNGARPTARRMFLERAYKIMANSTNRMQRISDYNSKGDPDLLNSRERRMNESELKDWYDSAHKMLKSEQRSFYNRMYSVVGKFLELPTSTSDYGRNNDKEDYAEAFGYYMSNKAMPAGIHDLFMSVSGLRKASVASVNPYLNVPPTELQKDLDKGVSGAKKRRQMQEVIDSWRVVDSWGINKPRVKAAISLARLAKEILKD